MQEEFEHVSPYSFSSLRFKICLLMMLGLATSVSMRVDLSMAVVCMVNSTAFSTPVQQTSSNVSVHEACLNVLENSELASESGYNGDLLWSPHMQSLLFSATFYGALVTTSFSGYIADRFGAKVLLLALVFDYVVVTLLTPWTARFSYYAYFGSRIMMGLGEGFTFPCLNSVAGKWFAPNERSSMAAIFTSGNQIAMIAATLISAELCASSWGWPSIFYLFGSLGIVWMIVWGMVFTNSPNSNKWMSEKEKKYLSMTVPSGKKKSHMLPWRQLLTSAPLWAALCCQYAFNLQASLLQAFVPTYLKEELYLPIASNGLYSTIPFINQLVFKNILGILADYLKRNKIVTHTKAVRIFQTISSTGSAVAMFCLAYFPSCHTPYLAHIILGAIGFFLSATVSGFYTSMLSLAPRHSGSMGSVAMIFGTLGNLSAPMILSALSLLTPDSKWPNLFIICSIINLFSGTFFFFCGSAETQSWGKEKVSDVDAEKSRKIEMS